MSRTSKESRSGKNELQRKSPPFVRFNFTVHAHQPVGNLPWVFEKAYETCYGPFLELMARHPFIRFSYHISGPLLEWLEERRPEHLDLLGSLVERGQVELLGGAFYEPIVTAVPKRDALGQIELMREYLRERFGFEVRGMWLAERVWEPHLPALLRQGGMEFTLVDDTHFLAGGVLPEDLHGYFLAEEAGSFIKLFPLLESLRYAIPFEEPAATLSLLQHFAEQQRGTVVVYGDDVEKFGVWPGTYKRCYEEKWLDRFLTALEENSAWISIVFLSEAIEQTEPRGIVYPPETSYTEMNEWTLPPEVAGAYRALRHRAKEDPQLSAALPFVRGPSWRSFRRKYPEIRRLYARALAISQRVGTMPEDSRGREARRELYRGQCNCPYWHGIFGGHYLPHLREAVWRHLLNAERIADEILPDGPEGAKGVVESADLDLDGRPEAYLRNEKLGVIVSPVGAAAVELDLRPWGLNLFSVLRRRPEAYHQQVREALQKAAQEAAEAENTDGTRSIHDLLTVKDRTVAQALAYDAYEHLGFTDLFFPQVPEPEAFLRGTVENIWGLNERTWKLVPRAETSAVDCVLEAEDLGIVLQKSYVLEGAELLVRYRISNRGESALKGFILTEVPFALQTGDSPNRVWHTGEKDAAGPLGTVLQSDRSALGIRDWDHDLALDLKSPGASFFTFPVRTVSQSEAGFEAVFQYAVVVWVRNLDLAPGGEAAWEISLCARKAPARTEVVVPAEKK